MAKKHHTIGPTYLDSFSGTAAELPPRYRTPAGVLSALKKDPRVSTFDMSELPWLRGCIQTLKQQAKIEEDKTEAYPWHKFIIIQPVGAA